MVSFRNVLPYDDANVDSTIAKSVRPVAHNIVIRLFS